LAKLALTVALFAPEPVAQATYFAVIVRLRSGIASQRRFFCFLHELLIHCNSCEPPLHATALCPLVVAAESIP